VIPFSLLGDVLPESSLPVTIIGQGPFQPNPRGTLHDEYPFHHHVILLLPLQRRENVCKSQTMTLAIDNSDMNDCAHCQTLEFQGR